MKSTLLSGVLAAVVVFVIPLFWIELATRGGRPTPCVPIDGRLLLTGIWLVWGVPVSLTAGLLGAGVGPVVLEAALEVGVEPTEGNLMVLADLGALPLESAGATRRGKAARWTDCWSGMVLRPCGRWAPSALVSSPCAAGPGWTRWSARCRTARSIRPRLSSCLPPRTTCRRSAARLRV